MALFKRLRPYWNIIPLARPVPQILVKYADYLIVSGLNSPYLFKSDGDETVIRQLVSLYNLDSNSSIPEGTNPIDVAALAKCYLASLPESLTTFELYNEIKVALSNIHSMRNILKKFSSLNYMTLEFVTALLLWVSRKSLLNKWILGPLQWKWHPLSCGKMDKDLIFINNTGTKCLKALPKKAWMKLVHMVLGTYLLVSGSC